MISTHPGDLRRDGPIGAGPTQSIYNQNQQEISLFPLPPAHPAFEQYENRPGAETRQQTMPWLVTSEALAISFMATFGYGVRRLRGAENELSRERATARMRLPM
ncbi:hypothetical protein D3C73_575250 [compost metagenome]